MILLLGKITRGELSFSRGSTLISGIATHSDDNGVNRAGLGPLNGAGLQMVPAGMLTPTHPSLRHSAILLVSSTLFLTLIIITDFRFVNP